MKDLPRECEHGFYQIDINPRSIRDLLSDITALFDTSRPWTLSPALPLHYLDLIQDLHHDGRQSQG